MQQQATSRPKAASEERTGASVGATRWHAAERTTLCATGPELPTAHAHAPALHMQQVWGAQMAMSLTS